MRATWTNKLLQSNSQGTRLKFGVNGSALAVTLYREAIEFFRQIFPPLLSHGQSTPFVCTGV